MEYLKGMTDNYGSMEGGNSMMDGMDSIDGDTEQSFIFRGGSIAKDLAMDKYNELYAWVTEGPTSLRVLAFFGGLGVFLSGLASVFDVFSPLNIILGLYLTVLGAMVMVLEMKRFPLLEQYQRKIEYWMKFLSQSWGRGVLYVFLGGITLAQWGIFDILVGTYMLVVGSLYFGVGYRTGSKLSDMTSAMGKGKETNPAVVRKMFDEFDRDGSGSIDVDELTELVSHLGVDMSDNEISAAMNYMDADRSDRIEWGEFHEWWSREDQMSFV